MAAVEGTRNQGADARNHDDGAHSDHLARASGALDSGAVPRPPTGGGRPVRGACVCNAESWPVALTTVGSVRAALIDMLTTGDQTGQLHQIQWQYSRDADVTLTFGGISTDEALRIAESVRPAPYTVWKSLPCSKIAPGVGEVACDPQEELPTGA